MNLVWKKNAQHLYDTLLVYELPWPSLTVQVFPEITPKQNQKGEVSATGNLQRVLLATNTGGQATEYVRIGEISYADIKPPQTLLEYDSEEGTIGGYHPRETVDFHIVQRIPARGAVLRARYMPQNQNVVAAVSATGEAAIWDVTKFPYNPVDDTYVPSAVLPGHEAEALDCSWSPTTEGELATCDAAGRIIVLNLDMGFDSRTGRVKPLCSRDVHEKATAVNAIEWHPRRPGVLASVGDDGWLHVHNTRSEDRPKFMSLSFDQGKPTCLAWNPVNDNLMAIGFDTGKIEMWDLSTSEPKRINSWTGHDAYITQLRWNTYHPSIVATASEDMLVKIWNVCEPEKPMFVHGGHSSPVTDLCWNPGEPGTVVSVAEDNSLQVWRASLNL